MHGIKLKYNLEARAVLCRQRQVLVPYELMRLGTSSAATTGWLAKSSLAPQLADAAQFERLLTVAACTAASCFLQARVLRHATHLAALAACYLFRAVRFCADFGAPSPSQRVQAWVIACIPPE